MKSLSQFKFITYYLIYHLNEKDIQLNFNFMIYLISISVCKVLLGKKKQQEIN